ncbi:threonine aldolase family protein [Candidatus Planktophila dulcis]|uniref:threonine aldolase family protein n=1 Tax=Candidatus Planktophila dulcis TaxID=1884914 RepID=UPI003CED40F9
MAIDLRSDTVTKPSEAMRAAMASAEVGDDVYGDDPTVNSLEERVAAMFGHQAGLFTPTGSLANQLSIRTLVKPGEELLVETRSHIVRAELGAAATFSGITTRTWPSTDGLLKADDALAIAHENAGPYLVSTKAIAVENTHNFGGGTVQPIDEIAKLSSAAHARGIAMHLDGARIWNAHVASGVSCAEYGKHFDTISVCLSKGLGSPIGSVMLSTKERVAEARIWRKRYGAGMRQVGIIAAAAHYALDNNIARLAEDHARAKKIATALAAIDSSLVDPSKVHTNIVGLELSKIGITATELTARCKDAGLWISALGPHYARLVTHLDFDDAHCDEAIEILKRTLVVK